MECLPVRVISAVQKKKKRDGIGMLDGNMIHRAKACLKGSPRVNTPFVTRVGITAGLPASSCGF
jgi:hypothetical protein